MTNEYLFHYHNSKKNCIINKRIINDLHCILNVYFLHLGYSMGWASLYGYLVKLWCRIMSLDSSSWWSHRRCRMQCRRGNVSYLSHMTKHYNNDKVIHVGDMLQYLNWQSCRKMKTFCHNTSNSEWSSHF